MLDYILAFCTLFCIDVFYSFYLKAVQRNKPLKSASWAAVVFTLSGMVVIQYTENHKLLIPAILGAFCGTYIGVKFQTNISKLNE